MFSDGLENTRKWLLRHFDINNDNYSASPDRVTRIRNITTTVLAEAYIELLDWDKNNQFPEVIHKSILLKNNYHSNWINSYPIPRSNFIYKKFNFQTLIIDEARLHDLQERLNNIIIIGAIILVTSSTVGASLQGVATFKDHLKEHLTVLLQSTSTEK